MRTLMWFAALVFSLNVAPVAGDVAAADLLVTRHFTGLWDQVDQESQGISLQVVEQDDGSKVAVAYWFTYGADRKTAWYLGIGSLAEDRIEFELYDSTDVGFMQAAEPGDDSVVAIGTMSIKFDSCDSGFVTYDTNHEEVGSGSFRIERLTEIMNTHCSGGISDDMGAFTMYGEQQIQLTSARSSVTGSGHARYGDSPGRSEFKVEVTGLPDGIYHLFVGMVDRGEFMVQNGFGEIDFRSPGETGKELLFFDPREMIIEIQDTSGVVLSSFESMFDRDNHDQMGYHEDHAFTCGSGMGSGSGSGMGMGMGEGMHNCVQEGEVMQIHSDLVNTGIIPAATGAAEWELSSQHVEFSVEIEDVPAGTYRLLVGGTEVGTFPASDMHGSVFGMIRFRDPEVFGQKYLDFEPRGQTIEVMSPQGDIILQLDFPEE